MDALNDIEEWFQTRARWEKTAYHLILSQASLDKETIEQLADECEADAIASKKKGGKIEDKEEASAPTDCVVRLLAIKNVQNVNRLVLDQALTFSPDGLTIVYGDNGAGKTGYEMEALVTVTAAALALYDMCKAADKGIEIREIALLEKTGGKSGSWRRGKGR